jgi:hypothetical protein
MALVPRPAAIPSPAHAALASLAALAGTRRRQRGPGAGERPDDARRSGGAPAAGDPRGGSARRQRFWRRCRMPRPSAPAAACRLARADAAAAQQCGQAPLKRHLQAGPAQPAHPADPRGQRHLRHERVRPRDLWRAGRHDGAERGVRSRSPPWRAGRLTAAARGPSSRTKESDKAVGQGRSNRDGQRSGNRDRDTPLHHRASSAPQCWARLGPRTDLRGRPGPASGPRIPSGPAVIAPRTKAGYPDRSRPACPNLEPPLPRGGRPYMTVVSVSRSLDSWYQSTIRMDEIADDDIARTRLP